MNLKIKSKIFPIVVILLGTFVFYTPIFIKPTLYINRGNDLQEFFWPIYFFVKDQIVNNHQIPFWNNMILSGTPLLPDPQAPFFYLPNIIFLFTSINFGFIFSIFIHTFFGGVGSYLAGRKVLNLNKLAAVFCAVLFVFSPKLAGYIEAGHFGLILSWGWLPWVFLSTAMIAKKPKAIWSVALAVSLAGLFYTHSTTFIYALFLSGLVFAIYFLSSNKSIKSIYCYTLGGILSFGLTAIALLSQISWISQTNRYLLAQNPQVWPIWNSKLEFIRQIIFPQNTDSEKWIPLGIVVIGLAIYGFIKIKKVYKVLLILFLFPILIISASNLTPLYSFLIKQRWFDYLRVTTRIWFAISLTTIALAGIGLQELTKKNKKGWIIYLIFLTAAIELLILSWVRLEKPAIIINYAPKEVYEFLAKDKDHFRVYCLTRCLSQKDAAINHLELIDGYSTLIQKNYNSHALQLTGARWNYYTLSVPPIGSLIEILHPNINSLGEYNTKYIISPYKIIDKDLTQATKIDKYFIYLNKLYQPRSPAPITYYSPNLIRIDTSNYDKSSIIISEVYSEGWKAYADYGNELQIQEAPNALRSIGIPTGNESLELKYQPEIFRVGKIITLSAIIIIICLAGESILDEKRKNKRV